MRPVSDPQELSEQPRHGGGPGSRLPVRPPTRMNNTQHGQHLQRLALLHEHALLRRRQDGARPGDVLELDNPLVAHLLGFRREAPERPTQETCSRRIAILKVRRGTAKHKSVMHGEQRQSCRGPFQFQNTLSGCALARKSSPRAILDFLIRNSCR